LKPYTYKESEPAHHFVLNNKVEQEMQIKIGKNHTTASPDAAGQCIDGFLKEHGIVFDYIRVSEDECQIEFKTSDGHKLVIVADTALAVLFT